MMVATVRAPRKIADHKTPLAWSVTRLPLAVKVPLVVAVLMIFVGVIVSERVMSRLIATQSQHIDDLANAYVAGLSPALTPNVIREDIWATFEILERSLQTDGAVRPLEAVVTNRAGLVVAATDPLRAPTLGELPAPFRAAALDGSAAVDAKAGTATLRRSLRSDGVVVGSISTLIDVEALIAERRHVTLLLFLTNGLLTLVCAALGFIVMVKLIQPMRILTTHLAADAQTGPSEIPAEKLPSEGTEGHRLLTNYNALARAEGDRRRLQVRLADEERIADLGHLASGMAHEINNPLGGLFNALDTIKRHGQQPTVREQSVALIERGLANIRDIVRATLHVYRRDRDETGFGPGDVDDVKMLVQAQLSRRAVSASWTVALDAQTTAPRSGTRQALLNLVLNAAVAAPPVHGQVNVDIRHSEKGRTLRVAVEDNGPGICDATAAILDDPDARRPVGQGGGLGLWMVRKSVTDAGGTIMWRRDDPGTTIVLSLPLDNGNLGGARDEAA